MFVVSNLVRSVNDWVYVYVYVVYSVRLMWIHWRDFFFYQKSLIRIAATQKWNRTNTLVEVVIAFDRSHCHTCKINEQISIHKSLFNSMQEFLLIIKYLHVKKNDNENQAQFS